MTIRAKRSGTLLHLILAIAVLLAITLAVFLAAITRASDISWAGSSDPGFTSGDRVSDADPNFGLYGCRSQQILVDGQSAPQAGCVTVGRTVRLAVYSSNGDYRLGVNFRSESKFYQLSNVTYHDYFRNPILIPGTDILYNRQSINSTQRSLLVYQDFTSKLSKTPNVFGHTEYTWNLASPDFTLKDTSNDEVLGINGTSHSSNGRWIVTEVMGRGMVRVDTQNLTAQVISRDYRQYNIGSNPVMNFAISNDGEHVAMGGQNAGFVMYDVPASCGDPVTGAVLSGTMPHPCPVKDYYNFITSRVTTDSLTWLTQPTFTDDGGELSFYFGNANSTDKPYVTLTAPGYVPAPQLDYLALGDSYSSGEGDIGRKPNGEKYYLPGTDVTGNYSQGVPEEKCHISARSYPFLLSQDMGLLNDKMKSIACSGAVKSDVQGWIINNDRFDEFGYEGQPETINSERFPRLKGLVNIKQLQQIGLDNFIPGRVQQIEFIKKYKPKAISITLGGNDVFFGKIIEECIKKFSGVGGTTCAWAEDTSEDVNKDGLRRLGVLIEGQFTALRDSYHAMKDAAPDSKIYAIGYPKFINTGPCLDNVPLNGVEKSMLVQGIAYMNKVIRAAAAEAGVYYVDIENSLFTRAQCDVNPDSYVNGSSLAIAGYESASFHPNARGHKAMFEKIQEGLRGQTLVNFNQCTDNQIIICPGSGQTEYPSIPAYFDPPTFNDRIIAATDMIRNVAQGANDIGVIFAKKGSELFGHLSSGSAEQNGEAKGQFKSDPIDLGTFTVNADGSLDFSFTIPASVPAGYHTLHIYTKTYSGEPIDYYQTIEVRGQDDNDVDDNGVPDNQQKCLYTIESGKDVDSDGIDDACDPEIGEPKEAYRIRGGVTANGEQENYLYIERNINATTLTGINGDYDPDHDGWAVVAASQNTAQAGPYARFWIDGNDGSKIPHVSLRTAENGCVQYKPANLAKVVDNSPRTFAQEAADTNTCRLEPATADLDNDGNPDNTQPLYRARNGITANGEDSRKLYLERSTRGTEAQLGKSDYASNATPPTGPTDTVDRRKAWSRLATSSPGLITDTYRKLVFINDQPYVLAANFLNQCYAYKSQSLATIKQSTQATRQLQLDWGQTVIMQISGGCN